MSVTSTVGSTDEVPQSLKQQERVKSLAKEIGEFLCTTTGLLSDQR